MLANRLVVGVRVHHKRLSDSRYTHTGVDTEGGEAQYSVAALSTILDMERTEDDGVPLEEFHARMSLEVDLESSRG